jgi:hypothetical protein
MKIKTKLKPGQLIRRNQTPVSELETGNCQNCDFEFKGHFCPNCGQEVAEFNRPFGFILYDFVGNFFAFDTRFFRTFKYLMIRPGFLTSEFFQGRRMRYSPPFRIFVFLSFVLFLLLQVITERSLDFEVSPNTSESKKEALVNPVLDENQVRLKIDSVKQLIAANIDTAANVEISSEDTLNEGFDLDLSEAIFTKGKLRDKLNKLAEILEGKLSKTADAKDRTQLQSYIAMCRNPEIVISTIMKYLSWSFFLLLPLFALILKLFYIRRKQNYIRHLIFSIHLHSFLFFILIVIVALRLIFTSGIAVVNLVLLISFPVYFVLALRHFYGQNYPKVILKFVGISAIYNIVLWSAVLFVFLKTLNLV